MKLTFLGANHEVTGSCTLLEAAGQRYLIDCGMEQGKDIYENQPIPVAPGEIDGVLATHAHIDHTGLLPLLATRDFMITPQFLKLRYKIASERVEFPTVEERAQLSEPNAGLGGTQGALLARDSFEGFLAAVSGARAMRGAAIGSIAIAVMGGAMGMLVLTFLTFLGATLSASCWNLFLYTLLWLAPGILITSLSSRR